MEESKVYIKIKTKDGLKITRTFTKHDSVTELTKNIEQYINESHKEIQDDFNYNSNNTNVNINCTDCCLPKVNVNADATPSACCFP